MHTVRRASSRHSTATTVVNLQLAHPVEAAGAEARRQVTAQLLQVQRDFLESNHIIAHLATHGGADGAVRFGGLACGEVAHLDDSCREFEGRQGLHACID